MAGTFTLSDIRGKIETDLDLLEETFISSSELNAYINEAIREAESEVHGLCEDYFLASTPLSVTAGTDSYDLPSDIYADKIRAIIYTNGTDIYRVKKLIHRSYQFEEIALINTYSPSLRYQFILTNNLSAGRKIKFFPNIRDTSSTNFLIYYIRDAQTLENDDDVLDIPEAYNFILAYAKAKCLAKENAGQVPGGIANELEHQREMLLNSLRDRVPDYDNEIEKDFSAYEEAT